MLVLAQKIKTALKGQTKPVKKKPLYPKEQKKVAPSPDSDIENLQKAATRYWPPFKNNPYTHTAAF